MIRAGVCEGNNDSLNWFEGIRTYDAHGERDTLVLSGEFCPLFVSLRRSVHNLRKLVHNLCLAVRNWC